MDPQLKVRLLAFSNACENARKCVFFLFNLDFFGIWSPSKRWHFLSLFFPSLSGAGESVLFTVLTSRFSTVVSPLFTVVRIWSRAYHRPILRARAAIEHCLPKEGGGVGLIFDIRVVIPISFYPDFFPRPNPFSHSDLHRHHYSHSRRQFLVGDDCGGELKTTVMRMKTT